MPEATGLAIATPAGWRITAGPIAELLAQYRDAGGATVVGTPTIVGTAGDETIFLATALAAAPDTVVPDTVAPGTVSAGTAVPGTAVPGTAVLGTVVPGTVIPGTLVSGTSGPDNAAPDSPVVAAVMGYPLSQSACGPIVRLPPCSPPRWQPAWWPPCSVRR